jgi:hypothetical protein
MLVLSKIHPHAKAGIMPSTHSSEEQENPTLSVMLGSNFFILAEVFR